MRIVHEIAVPMQVTASATKNESWVNVSFFSAPASNYPSLPEADFETPEEIYIEGDVRYVRRSLQEALDDIETLFGAGNKAL
jgi:hypothetical protein